MIERVTMGQLMRGTITDWSLSESSRISTSGGGPDQWGWQTGHSGPLPGSERGFRVGGASKSAEHTTLGKVRRGSLGLAEGVVNPGWQTSQD